MSAYLGVMDAPPDGFLHMRCLTHHPYEVWAQGSMWSEGFRWCYVRRSKHDRD